MASGQCAILLLWSWCVHIERLEIILHCGFLLTKTMKAATTPYYICRIDTHHLAVGAWITLKRDHLFLSPEGRYDHRLIRDIKISIRGRQSLAFVVYGIRHWQPRWCSTVGHRSIAWLWSCFKLCCNRSWFSSFLSSSTTVMTLHWWIAPYHRYDRRCHRLRSLHLPIRPDLTP